ncbi:MAG: FAD-dependent oxidoreductase [Elusimicrobia bacterium]|nr:FAD-dependent oxidoreductase [Elusimicrobiota bacterium]
MPLKIAIIGAGISGLSCAYHLKKYRSKAETTVYEAQDKIGGLCGSYTEKGFTFDYSGHLLHTSKKAGKKLTQELLGGNKNTLSRQAYVFYKGKKIDFPFQNNLYALNPKEVSAFVSGAIKAYAKPSKNTAFFKDWAMSLYGKGICEAFMFPYNSKLWNYPLNKMSSAWCGKFIPASALEDIIKGAYAKRKKAFGYNSVFDYPKKGGCAAICEALAQNLTNIKLNSPIKNIDLKNKTCTAGGKKISYDKLVSTMPLPELGKAAKELPLNIRNAFKKLKHNSLYVLNIAFDGKAPKGHWFYFPEKEYPFYRVGVQSAFSKNSAPKGTFSLYIEFSVKQNKRADLKKLKAAALDSLKKLGFIKEESKILTEKWIYIRFGYPIYDKDYAKARAEILDYMAKQDIYLLGRYGAWEYSFMEKSLLDAASLAKTLAKVKL